MTININKPFDFWNEFNIQKILYYSSLRDSSSMNYWLKILCIKKYLSCKYLILQFLFMSMAIDDNFISRYNINKFVSISGVTIVANILSGLYHFQDDIFYNYTPLKIHKQATEFKMKNVV